MTTSARPPPPLRPGDQQLVNLSLENLPLHVLSAILGGFCEGKAISTVLLHVAQGTSRTATSSSSSSWRASAQTLCRGILVQRFTELAAMIRREDSELELGDVLDVIREDIRTSAAADTAEDDSYHQQSSSWITQFSRWCAILDYVERHWKFRLKYPTVPLQWMVWNGTLEVPYGPIHAVLTTSQWTAGALSYWHNRELSSRLILTHPRSSHLAAIVLPLYGTLLGITAEARHKLYLQNRDLSFRRSDNNNEFATNEWGVPATRALIAMDELYTTDPSIALVATNVTSQWDRAGIGTVPLESGDDDDDDDNGEDDDTDESEDDSDEDKPPETSSPQRHYSMQCYWDVEQGDEGDWEDAVAALGEHTIRIMNQCSTANANDCRNRFRVNCLESCLEDVYSNLEHVES